MIPLQAIRLFFRILLSLCFTITILSVSAQQKTYISNGSSLYLVDLETCAVDSISTFLGPTLLDIAYCPSSEKLYGIGDNSHIYEFDLKNMVLKQVMETQLANSLICDINGLLYSANAGKLYRMDPQNQTTTILLDTAFLISDGDLVFYQNDLYLSTTIDGLVKIKLGTKPSAVKLSKMKDLKFVYGMVTEFGACREDFYVMSVNDIYKLNEWLEPQLQCEDIIEQYIFGAASNTEVFSQFTLVPEKDVFLCEGDPEVDIDASYYSATYLWNNGSTNAKLSVNRPGEYWVDVTLGECTKRDTVEAFSQSKPIVELGDDISLCEGKEIILNAYSEGGNYLWQDSSTSASYEVIKDGKYYVRVDVNGCTTSDTININRYYCEPVLEMPNVVTPNNDGFNDKLVPKEIENIEQMYTSIFNRFGKKVFETDNPLIEWSPIDVPSGLYYYLVSFSEVTGTTQLKKGWVQVLK